jgi:hypothetical protein
MNNKYFGVQQELQIELLLPACPSCFSPRPRGVAVGCAMRRRWRVAAANGVGE